MLPPYKWRRVLVKRWVNQRYVVRSIRSSSESFNVQDSQLVAHHVRYDATVDADTRIVFMTDGVLLRQMNEQLHLPE